MMYSEDTSILMVLGITSFIAFGGIVALILFKIKKKELESQINKHVHDIDRYRKMMKIALEARENEDKKIAKELHDNIGMMLMTLRVNLSNQAEGPIQELRELVDETHESVKKIAWNLMPTTLDNFGLFQSIQELSHRASNNKDVIITCLEHGDRQSLDKDQELLIYRIVQEAVSNALRHAHATTIEVLLTWKEKFLNVSIKDDGVGFNFPKHQSKVDGRHGLGLYNLENRVNLLNGEISFLKNNPTGSIIAVNIPIT